MILFEQLFCLSAVNDVIKHIYSRQKAFL